MINPMDLSGKKILVAGGAHGIGCSISIQLSKLGALVLIMDEDETSLKYTISSLDNISNHKSFISNIFDNTKIENGIKNILSDCGEIDGFVFSVSHSEFRPLSFVNHDNIYAIMNDNYYSFIAMVRSLAKYKGLRPDSSIVVLSSISSFRGMKAKMAFCSSKAAVDAAVRCLAIELGSKHIRVNSIQKGGVDVDYAKEQAKNIVSINANETEKKQFLGITNSFEIANVAAFLLSDAAKTITGTSIVIDGGYTL